MNESYSVLLFLIPLDLALKCSLIKTGSAISCSVKKKKVRRRVFFDTKVYKLNVVFHSCLSFLEVDNTPPYVACVSQRDLGYII